MVEGLSQKIQGRNSTLWTKNLFKVDKSSNQLGQKGKKPSIHLWRRVCFCLNEEEVISSLQ